MSLTAIAMILLLGAVAMLPWLREKRRVEMDTEARRGAPGKFVRLSRGLTHYQTSDSARGPWIVLIHGLTTPSFVWDGLVPYLEALGFRVLRYDLYGRGFSDRPKGRQTPEFFVAQLAELLATHEIEEEVTLVGYSMGGVIATAFADAHPDMIRRIVLIAPAGMGHTLETPGEFAVETPYLGDWAFHMLYPSSFHRGVEAERDLPSSVPDIGDLQLNELAYRGFLPSVLSSLRGSLRNDMQAAHRRLSKTGIPVLAIWGDADAVIPLSGLGKLAEWNRRAQQETVKGGGHGLPYTHPKALADTIRDAVGAPVL